MILKNIDCLELLKTLPNDSVDLVLVDPPYSIGFDGGKGWDRQWKSEKEYLDWCELWSKEAARVLKNERMLCVWGTLKSDTFLRYKLEVLNKIPSLFSQNEIVWSYNWGGRTKQNFARKHEYLWCYSKGKKFLFNADDVRIERKVSLDLRTGKPHEKGTIPTCVWEKNNHTTSSVFCNWHPTTKNVEILERLIKAYTNEGDTVLDFFSGSGSTALACKNTKRNFIGCEKDEEYFKKSLERINGSQTTKLEF